MTDKPEGLTGQGAELSEGIPTIRPKDTLPEEALEDDGKDYSETVQRWGFTFVREPAEGKPGDKSSDSQSRDGTDGTSTSKLPGGAFHFQQLMNLPIEQPKEIVEGLIHERQNVLLMGRFGVGKTMLGMQLSLHLAIGRDFLGLRVPRAFRTTYLDFENDLGDIRNRISKQESLLAPSQEEGRLLNENWIYVDAGEPEHPLHRVELDAPNQLTLDPLKDFLAREAPEVLFIDNLGLIASKGDLKEPDEAKRFYANIQYLRSKVESLKNGAVIVFHHLTKPGELQATSPVSLLTNPYEYLSRARGSGRVLDFARTRLALAEEKIGELKCHVLNGINRSATLSPLILQFNSETLSFERHENTKIRFDAVFGVRPRGKEIYRLLPEEFTFGEAAKITDPKTGKPLNKGTLSETLKTAIANDFVRYDSATKRYKKIFEPQSD